MPHPGRHPRRRGAGRAAAGRGRPGEARWVWNTRTAARRPLSWGQLQLFENLEATFLGVCRNLLERCWVGWEAGPFLPKRRPPAIDTWVHSGRLFWLKCVTLKCLNLPSNVLKVYYIWQIFSKNNAATSRPKKQQQYSPQKKNEFWHRWNSKNMCFSAV